jgi:hypothetical protein
MQLLWPMTSISSADLQHSLRLLIDDLITETKTLAVFDRWP